MHGFDAVDVRLVNLLQQNGRCSIKQLAEQVFMSPPAVTARLARLEKMGAISGYKPIINLAMFGYNVTAFISLQLTPGDKPRFTQHIAACPNVMECNNVTGDYSMLIKGCFHNTKELDAFVGDLQRFGKTHTQVVFSSVVGVREPMLEP